MDIKFISRLRDFDCSPHVKIDREGNETWDSKTWINKSDLLVRMPDGSVECISAGFITNFGSIPRTLRSFLNRMGYSLRAFVVHDWLYSKDKGKYKQRKCDNFLYTLGRFDGEGYFAAKAINKGLLLGGWANFKKTDAIIEKVSRRTLNYTAHSNGYNLVDKFSD